MKIDEHGCVIMQSVGWPGDIGDSCAETGRYIVLRGSADPQINLMAFVTDIGFIRHPTSPWKEDTFTTDQALYLLMAADLTDRPLRDIVVSKLRRMGWQTAPGKPAHPNLYFLAHRWYQLCGLTEIAQMMFNLIPFRWHDGNDGTESWGAFRRRFWRFKSAEGSTVSFMTTLLGCIFLKRVGVRWPLRILNKEKYLAKTRAYYANQPNSEWFVAMFERATYE